MKKAFDKEKWLDAKLSKKRARQARIRAAGGLVETETEATYANRVGRLTVRRSAGWITGENYVPSGCDCDTPPWEWCPHSIF